MAEFVIPGNLRIPTRTPSIRNRALSAIRPTTVAMTYLLGSESIRCFSSQARNAANNNTFFRIAAESQRIGVLRAVVGGVRIWDTIWRRHCCGIGDRASG